MPRLSFCIEDMASSARMPAWQSVLSKFALWPQDLDQPGRMVGRVEHVYWPMGLGFSLMESGPQRLVSAIERRGEEMYFLSLVAKGKAMIELNGRLVHVEPGDLIYGKRGAVGALEMHTPFRFLNINIPASIIARSVHVPLPEELIHLRGESPSTRILAAMMGEIARSIGQLDGHSHTAIETAVLQLLVNCIFEESGKNPLGGFATTRATVLRGIWQTIEDRLQDGAMTLNELAAVHRLSPRYVQQLFQESGNSFRSYVRQRRLERCRAILCDPVYANLSLTEICLAWGFGDSASFSRAFRDAYGQSPSTMRREMLIGVPDRRQRLYRLDH